MEIQEKEGILGVKNLKYKARLMVGGFTPKEGVNFNEIFSPVVKHSLIRILLIMVAFIDFELKQMDVKTTILHSNLEEKILMSQPDVVLKQRDMRNMFFFYISRYIA